MSNVYSYRAGGGWQNPQVSAEPAESSEEYFRRMSRQFIQEVKKAHGADMSKRVIEKLGEALGKEWGLNIIYDLVARDVDGPEGMGDRVRFYFDARHGRGLAKISVIKEMRAVTGMGLKESKDAVDILCEACENYFVNNPSGSKPPMIELICKSYEESVHIRRNLSLLDGVVLSS